MCYIKSFCMLSFCGMVVINILLQPRHETAWRFQVDASAFKLNYYGVQKSGEVLMWEYTEFSIWHINLLYHLHDKEHTGIVRHFTFPLQTC